MNADLHKRWHDVTGEDMPVEFAELPRHLMLKAVEAKERGDTPFIPKPVKREEREVSSMAQWDHQDDKCNNAYG